VVASLQVFLDPGTHLIRNKYFQRFELQTNMQVA
jgi:hypothetical protein